MLYRHYAAAPGTLDRSRVYAQTGRSGKPRGLWIDCDGDWRRWCEDEQWGLDKLAVVHRVEFAAERILWLPDEASVATFHDQYSEPLDGVPNDRVRSINWTKVASQYAGVACIPYHHDMWRFDIMWYYGWDCASLCVWDLSVITSFALEDNVVRSV